VPDHAALNTLITTISGSDPDSGDSVTYP